MDENKLRSALGVIASDPEPPTTTVDLAAARRRGRRRQRARHVVVPVAVALAVAAAVIVPVTQFRAAPRPAPAIPVPPPMPAHAPSTFNALVPYAAFGWLPKGFSETLEPPSTMVGMYSGTDEVHRAAWSRNARSVSLQVTPRGACQRPGFTLTGNWWGPACYQPTADFSRQLPPVNGRPALRVTDGIAWEYAPDAWASVTAGPGVTASGRTIPALSRAELYQVASHVVFGSRRPIYFPFRLAGGLPSGWRAGGMGFRVSGTRLVYEQSFRAGPASRPDTDYVFSIDMTSGKPLPLVVPCHFTPGKSSYLNRDGVRWITTPASAEGGSSVCVANPDPRLARHDVAGRVDGLQVNIGAGPSGPMGDALSVLGRLTLLGPDPANWTDQPFR